VITAFTSRESWERLDGCLKGRRTSMTRGAKTKALLGAIERRLTDMSGQRHALAVEKAHLLEQLTPLRLGIVVPTPPWSSSRSKGSRSED
jgi:hypothetical protein